MSNHTPGPWKQIGFDLYRRIENSQGGVICHFKRCRPSLMEEPASRDKKVVEANGDLIAAAPELLAALEVLTLDPLISKHIDRRAMEQASKAIRKAKGTE